MNQVKLLQGKLNKKVDLVCVCICVRVSARMFSDSFSSTLSKWSPGKVLMTTRPGIPVSPHSPVGQTPILPSRSHYVSQPRSHSQTHTLSPLYLLFVSQVWSMSLSCFSFFLSLSLLPFAPPLPPLSLSSPLKLIFSFKRISLWQRCDWGCVFNRCVHWGPESASLTLYVCVVIMSWGGQFHRVFTVSVRWSRESVCMWTILVCQS